MGLGNGSANEPYVGVGVGIYGNTVDVPAALAPGASVDETATKLGFRLLLGMNFAENAFVEASYRLSGSTADVQTGAYGLSLGYRFQNPVHRKDLQGRPCSFFTPDAQ